MWFWHFLAIGNVVFYVLNALLATHAPERAAWFIALAWMLLHYITSAVDAAEQEAVDRTMQAAVSAPQEDVE